MKRALPCAVLLFALTSITANAADVAPAPGKKTFDRYCAECHSPGFGHPGTQQLGWARGEQKAVLEQRTDLVAPYVVAIVRNGLMEMPAFRPTEIDDATLQALAEYLARPGKKR
jgi:(+)-pinoresinol hydroxylase